VFKCCPPANVPKQHLLVGYHNVLMSLLWQRDTTSEFGGDWTFVKSIWLNFLLWAGVKLHVGIVKKLSVYLCKNYKYHSLVMFLSGGVHKVNEKILCRSFLFLLKRKTKAQLQQSHCELSRSRKCGAAQKSPFWIRRFSDLMAPNASHVFTGLPSEPKKQIRNMTSPCYVCACLSFRHLNKCAGFQKTRWTAPHSDFYTLWRIREKQIFALSSPSVRMSVCLLNERGSHWTNFREIWYGTLLWNFVAKSKY
jgi:hypothetical protein